MTEITDFQRAEALKLAAEVCERIEKSIKANHFKVVNELRAKVRKEYGYDALHIECEIAEYEYSKEFDKYTFLGIGFNVLFCYGKIEKLEKIYNDLKTRRKELAEKISDIVGKQTKEENKKEAKALLDNENKFLKIRKRIITINDGLMTCLTDCITAKEKLGV